MRIIIQCPERILHLEAEYIYADCLSPTSNLLQSGGGPYIFANYGNGVRFEIHFSADPSSSDIKTPD